MKRALGLVVVVAVGCALSGCGGGSSTKKTGAAAARAAALVPRDALAFASLSLEPSEGQKSDVASVLEKLPVPEKTFDALKDRALGDVAHEAGLDYQADVKPWLGDEAALAVLPNGSNPDVVRFLRSTDDVKAKAAVDKATSAQKGEDVARVVNGFVVIVPKARATMLDVVGRQGADASTALAGQDSFTRVTRQLHDERLLMAWFDGHALVQLAKAAGSSALGGGRITVKDLPDLGPGALDVRPEHQAMSLSGVVETPGTTGGGATGLTGSLPSNSIGALSLWNIGGNFQSALSEALRASTSAAGLLNQVQVGLGIDLQKDVLAWMHGEAVIVGGPPTAGTTPDLALLVQPTDRAVAEGAVTKVVAAVEQRLGIKLDPRPAPGGGTEYVLPGAIRQGVQPALALLKDKFVLASSPEYLDAVAKGGDFGSSSAFTDTLGAAKPGTQFQLVLKGSALPYVESYLAPDVKAQYEKDGKKWLEHLDALGVRVRKDGGLTRFEAKATLK